MRSDDSTLLDLVKAARLAREFMGGITCGEFVDDAKTQSAVLHPCSAKTRPAVSHVLRTVGG